MKIIHRRRAGGKTAILLSAMQKNENLIFVAATNQMADAAWRQSKRQGFRIPRTRFIPAYAFLEAHEKGRSVETQYVVDELDKVLEVLLGRPVHSAAYTGSLDSEILLEEL